MKNENKNVGICPPCGENVGLPTKRGANKVNLFGPLLTAVLPQSGKTNLITLLWHCVPLPPHRGEDEVVVLSLPQGREITAHGFTLIELLVVVLIIGILAAVAIPQYQKAVEKSRATQALTLLKSLEQAQKTYYLANGKYATTFNQLDIDMPADWAGNTSWYPSGYGFTDTRSNAEWAAQIYQPESLSAILVGRLTGPYQGAGFAYFFKEWGTLPANTLVCVEQHEVFDSQPKTFCGKLFHANQKIESGTLGSFYKMP